jgi:hypothetical protein
MQVGSKDRWRFSTWQKTAIRGTSGCEQRVGSTITRPGRPATGVLRGGVRSPAGQARMSASMVPVGGSLSFRRIMDVPFGTCVAALDSWQRTGHGELRAGESLLRGPAEHDRETGTRRAARGSGIVPDMPKTRSGKIMRRVIASISNFADVGDVTTLANPEIVDAIRQHVQAPRPLTSIPRRSPSSRVPASPPRPHLLRYFRAVHVQASA